MFSRSFFIVVEETETPTPGGTSYQASLLVEDPDITTYSANSLTESLDLLQQLGPGKCVVFTQQEGHLNATYKSWALRCLALGAVIIEKNVFGVPSRFRPRHPRYLMALMTPGSVARFKIRSLGALLRCPQHYLLRPNRLRSITFAPNTEGVHGKYRLLRIGRPDARKWTHFEVSLAERMVELVDVDQVELSLVGAPVELLPIETTHADLTIRCSSYSPDAIDFYGLNDIYLHYSKIGETYGNTLAEAQASGVFVVFVAEPDWDCSPVWFLDPQQSITCTREWALGNAEHIRRRSDLWSCFYRNSEATHDVSNAYACLTDPLVLKDSSALISMLGLRESVRVLSEELQLIEGKPSLRRVFLAELRRGIWWRIRSWRYRN